MDYAAGGYLAEPDAFRPTGIRFWDALDASEREALISVASWQTFAPGDRLMQEGEQADHVIVIFGGRTKISVNENGRERVLAIRGLGQLVGERAAQRTSTRSATVTALDMVWALVAQAKDFAAFIANHSRVQDILERQLYDRLTEAPIEYQGHDAGQAHSRRRRARITATAGQRPWDRALAAPPGATERGKPYRSAFVFSNSTGLYGEAIDIASRLSEGAHLEEAAVRDADSLIVISPFVYEMVVRYGPDLGEAASYTQARVEVKGASTDAWMKVVTARPT